MNEKAGYEMKGVSRGRKCSQEGGVCTYKIINMGGGVQ